MRFLNSKIKKISVAVIIVLIIAAAAYFASIMLWSFSGEYPDFDIPDAELQTARSVAIQKTAAELEKIEGALTLQKHAVAFEDGCYRGDKNPTSVDEYAYQCTHKESRFYIFNGDIVPEILKLEGVTSANEWQALAGYGDVWRRIESSFDRMFIRKNGTLTAKGVDIFDNPYLINSIYIPEHHKSERFTLRVKMLERAPPHYKNFEHYEDGRGLESTQRISSRVRDRAFPKDDDAGFIIRSSELLDGREVYRNVLENNKYLIVITVAYDYARVDW